LGEKLVNAVGLFFIDPGDGKTQVYQQEISRLSVGRESQG